MQSLHDWFQTPLGAYLLAHECNWLDHTVSDIFGYHAVQLGLPAFDLLRESRISHRVTIAPNERATVRAHFHELPLETQSVDLCVLPHVLEFCDSPHEILRETDRIMIPEGRILILNFNPWSLFGLRRATFPNGYPWCGRFVSLVRMKDWLQLLGFEVSTGRLACYVPPCESEKWIGRWKFMEPAGDRWWGVGGGVYMLEAIKRVQGMRIIAPPWADVKARPCKFAVAAKRQGKGELADAAKTATPLRLVK